MFDYTFTAYAFAVIVGLVVGYCLGHHDGYGDAANDLTDGNDVRY